MKNTFYGELRERSHDIGDYIASVLDQEGLLSKKAADNLSFLHNDISQAIRDWISDCQTEENEQSIYCT